MARLGDLGDGIDATAVMHNADEHRRRGEIAVPEVVTQYLIVPNMLAGSCVERDHAVGVEIVAEAIAAPEVVRRGAGRNEDHGVSGVEGDT